MKLRVLNFLDNEWFIQRKKLFFWEYIRTNKFYTGVEPIENRPLLFPSEQEAIDYAIYLSNEIHFWNYEANRKAAYESALAAWKVSDRNKDRITYIG